MHFQNGTLHYVIRLRWQHPSKLETLTSFIDFFYFFVFLVGAEVLRSSFIFSSVLGILGTYTGASFPVELFDGELPDDLLELELFDDPWL